MGARVIITRFSALGDVAMLAAILPEFMEQNPEVELFMVSRPSMKMMFPKHSNFTYVGLDVDYDYKGVLGIRKMVQELKKIQATHFADCHNVLRTQVLHRLMKEPKIAILDKGKSEKKKLTRKNNKEFQPLRSMHERYADVFRELGFSFELSHQYKSQKGPKSGIGIAPFAYYSEKMLAIEKSKELAEKLASEGKDVFLFGGGELESEILREWESLHPKITSLAGKFDLKEEMRVISQLECMVSMDSANMHLASLAGTRVLSIWGSTHPYAGFLGYGQKIEDCIQKDLFCRPCSVYGNKSCYRKNLECLKEIEVQDILNKISL